MISENIRTIPFIIVAISLGVLGQVLMKYGMNRFRDNPPPGATGNFGKDFKYILLSSWVLAGFGSYGVSTVIWLYVLTRAELSFAYPFISISYIAIILIGPWLFKEVIDGWKVLAIVLIILGVLSMTVSEKVEERNEAKGEAAAAFARPAGPVGKNREFPAEKILQPGANLVFFLL